MNITPETKARLEAANQGNLQLLADLIIERYEHSLDQLFTEELTSRY